MIAWVHKSPRQDLQPYSHSRALMLLDYMCSEKKGLGNRDTLGTMQADIQVQE